ncbi:unnamed protein product [Rotaria sordida]|uniref:DDE-1 domain-containing protein n=1 Tax=Rotaria sordida TaxID=392033 RepID=A0A814QTE1_9BILA|nr:unnamed protein product [Rotaria sordida]
MVQSHVEVSLNRKVSLSTIKRYGRKVCGIRSGKTHEVTSHDSKYTASYKGRITIPSRSLKTHPIVFILVVDKDYWYEIGKFRKFLQRIDNNRLMFLDEIAIYSTMPPHRTLVAPGHQPLIIVDKPTAYAERYDFIGAINGSQAIVCMTLTPADRRNKDIKGVRKEVLNEWIIKSLAPAINRLHIDGMHLICDRSRTHNKANMMKALRNSKCKSVIDIHYMPTASAKYISPLDNPLWHSFREVIRKQHPLTTSSLPSILSQTFYSLSRIEISGAYRKCVITYGADVYYDKKST